MPSLIQAIIPIINSAAVPKYLPHALLCVSAVVPVYDKRLGHETVEQVYSGGEGMKNVMPNKSRQ